ncbi:MAG TPA: cytochrome c [Methylophilaceae bacterium]|nr:cytochrome c [Methylophilaceae bacterium]
MRNIFVYISLLAASNVALAADPFAQGDAKVGKAMLEKNCIACHAAKYGGDGSGIYTRENRKVNSSSQLLTQVRNCNTMLGLKWFEDEELNVAKYLNQAYYKFDK